MAEPKNMTLEALCLVYAINEERIANMRGAQREILDEIKSRKAALLDKFRRGELPLEYSEIDAMITKEGEEECQI